MIDIELVPNSDNADLLFIVYDPDGNQVWSIDEAQLGEAEQVLAYPIMNEGRWSIVVREFYGEPATYTLQLEGE